MRIEDEFDIALPVAVAWDVLTDSRRIAPYLPGAELDSVVGDAFQGSVRVKVGPITAHYNETARFIDKSDETHTAVLSAEGQGAHGQGRASATVSARLTDVGGATRVSLATDLAVTGKVAQFGRGV